jgi:hypothetical protein
VSVTRANARKDLGLSKKGAFLVLRRNKKVVSANQERKLEDS